jgi:hypothetical protein
MSNLTIVVWQPLARTVVLVLWIIKDQKILTNVSAQRASQANTASQTLTIVKSTLAKTEEPVLILLMTTNVTA